MLKKAILFSATLMVSSLGMAQQFTSLSSPSEDECHRKDSTIEIQACDSQRYQYADKQLNAIYSAAIKSLDEERKIKLLDSQREWIKFRDANFALVLSLNNDAGSYGGIVFGNYKANFVADRVKELVNIFTQPSGDMPEWWPATAPTWRQLKK